MLPLAEVDMEVFNVRDYGALGNGDADDTNAIQMAIDAASQAAAPDAQGGIVYFPAGQYIIRAPLVITGQAGLKLVGSGVFEASKVGLSHVGPRTSLVWDPGVGVDPILLHLKGCCGMTIRDMAFYGSLEGIGAVTLVRIEDLVDQPSAMNTFCRVAFIRAELGIEAEVAAGECHFEHVAFDRCTTGFKAIGPGSANWLFRHLVGMNTETVVDLEEGGCLDAHWIELITCGKDDVMNPSWCFKFGAGGPSVRCSRISFMHIEQATKRLLWLHGDHRLTIESYSEGTDCEGTCVIDGGALALLACSFRTHPLIQWSAVTGRKTTIRFRDCILESAAAFSIDDWIVDATTEPGCFYSLERCDKANNVPIPDDKSAW